VLASLALGLSAGQKAGLLAVAGSIIAFALVCSMVVPARWPDFPGRGRNLFIAAALGFTAATLIAVVFLAVESTEGHKEARPETPIAEPAAPSAPAETVAEPGTAVEGDATAGKAVFTGASGCAGCHTLAAAEAEGTVGPNLDEAKPEHDLIVDRVTNGRGGMPAFKGRLSESEIADVAAFVEEATH
jgi:mono/diheme cytochrome c family protein